MKASPSDLARLPGYKLHLFFDRPDQELAEGAEDRLSRWYYNDVPEEVRYPVERGEIRLSVYGFASGDPSNAANQELAQKRAMHIERVVHRIAGERVRVDAIGNRNEESNSDLIVVVIPQ